MKTPAGSDFDTFVTSVKLALDSMAQHVEFIAQDVSLSDGHTLRELNSLKEDITVLASMVRKEQVERDPHGNEYLLPGERAFIGEKE